MKGKEVGKRNVMRTSGWVEEDVESGATTEKDFTTNPFLPQEGGSETGRSSRLKDRTGQYK
eukprot:2057412-Karenia_brevis.AAC.1